ncbi:YceI family protein [Tateyamaria sp. Alg231-49]|uniref:YceI family protein n=1 Tax=Tateyamaria sp. Alg231-49 TaxID=1922219 RepID=UPI000D54E219|nr:YceI family protein [Tateyamaria sp. Alg231-49]
MHRRHILALGLAAIAAPTWAAPTPYRLNGAASTITYTFTLEGTPLKGTVPIDRAELQIDPTNLEASTADVTADVRRAKTGLIFATEALKSRSVLAADDFPLARFQSTKVTLGARGRISEGATIEGMLTLRGVTKPVRFDAQLFRAPGSAADDLSALRVILKGSINRADFDAVGYADLVDDTVAIEIDANIEATG